MNRKGAPHFLRGGSPRPGVRPAEKICFVAEGAGFERLCGWSMKGQIDIAGERRQLDDLDSEWVVQRVDRMRADGLAVWVRVTINDGAVNIVLQTPGCPPTSRGSRKPNADEQRVFDLWDKHDLSDSHFSGGEVVSFLHDLGR
jgi:hypothetical protein